MYHLGYRARFNILDEGGYIKSLYVTIELTIVIKIFFFDEFAFFHFSFLRVNVLAAGPMSWASRGLCDVVSSFMAINQL